LGTATRGIICPSQTASEYYYWEAPGTFVADDRFEAEVVLRNPSQGDTLSVYLDGAPGTFTHSMFGPSLSFATPSATLGDINPFVAPGTALHFLAFGHTTTPGAALEFDFTVRNTNPASACSTNRSDGTAPPANPTTFTLGTPVTTSACAHSNELYYYWVSDGVFAAGDEFTAHLRQIGGASTDSITMYLDNGTGTFTSSEYGPSVSQTQGTEETLMDIVPFSEAGTRLHVLIYASSQVPNLPLNFEFTVTRQ